MFWDIYNIIAGLFIATQVLFLFQMIQNYRYALHKSSKKRDILTPKVPHFLDATRCTFHRRLQMIQIEFFY